MKEISSGQYTNFLSTEKQSAFHQKNENRYRPRSNAMTGGSSPNVFFEAPKVIQRSQSNDTADKSTHLTRCELEHLLLYAPKITVVNW